MAANVVDGLQINIIGNVSPFAQAMDKAERIAKAQSKAIRDAMNKEMQESKHSLALFGEAFGVTIPRHIRGFISELPGVSKAMSAAFSGLAVLVVIDVIAKAVEKVKQLAEAFKAFNETQQALKEGTEKILEPMQDRLHSLQLETIKAKNETAKLLGKHQDLLSQQLAEATVKADKLSKELRKATDDTMALFKAQDHGLAAKTFTGVEGTEQAQKIEKEYKERLAQIPHDEHYTANAQKLESETMRKAQSQLNKNTEANSGIGAYLLNNPHRYEDANAALTDLINIHAGNSQTMRAEDQAEDAENQRRKVADQKAAESKEVQKWEEQLANTREQYALHGYEMTKAEEAEFWLDRLALVQKGSEAYNAVNRKASADMVASLKEAQAEQAQLAKFGREYTINHDGDKDAIDGQHAINKATEDWVKESAKSVEISQKNANAQAEYTIRLNESLGYITKLDAAQQLATIHAREHQQVIEKLNADLDALKHMNISDAERKARQQKIQNEVDTENGRYNVTRINDAAALQQTLQSTLRSSLSGVNQQLTNLMTGKKADFGSVFSQAGSSMIHTGLEKAEGALFSKLGFGKLGTRANPMITQDVNSAGTVSSLASGLGGKLGGFLGTVGKFFGGFFADGGSPDPYKASVVGERGPELFVPRGVSGKVVSNKDLARSFSQGGVTYQIGNIDATGTNAAEVDMRVKQGMVVAHNQAVQSTQVAMQERNRRVPSSMRGK